MIIIGDDSIGIWSLHHFLSQHFEMKDLGTFSYFLGLEVTSSSDGYYLSQAKYASNILFKADIIENKTISTPLEYNAKLTPLDGEPISDATRNLGITLSSKLPLRWFKMLWNAKTKLYNFCDLSFEKYGLHQDRNRAWSCCTCIADVLECSFACNSNMQIWWGLFTETSWSGAQNF